MARPLRILGVDPGTGILGFGVIEINGTSTRVITAGVIKTPAHTPLEDRLLEIYEGITKIIEETTPEVLSIEKLYFSRNITTGIGVSHARGVVMLAARQAELFLAEYTPMQIKQTLTGYGKANKKQVQEMVREHLKLKEIPRPDDAADALAAAITYQFMARYGLDKQTPTV
jgi:crossover junction endodeoxyribonuclease ruvC